MQKIRGRIATVVALVVLTSSAAARADTIDQFNESASLYGNMWTFNEVGWYYTPSQTFELTGVETIFGTATGTVGANITLEVYNAGATAPLGALDVLFDDSFTVAAANAWTGVTGIVGGPQLDAGSTYFIGFKGVNTVGTNFTGDSPADELVFGASSDGTYSGGPPVTEATRAILRITGTPVSVTSVPEPASASLLAIGSLLIARRRLRLRG